MEVESHHSLAALEKLYRAESNAMRARNLRLIILAKQGWPATDIELALGLTRRVVQRWVYAYNKEGLPGLEDDRGAPSKPLLTPEQEQQFVARVEAGAQPEDQVCSLRGKDFQRILEAEFGKLRSLGTIYNLLHRLKYSYLRPRPRHHKADGEKQAEFLRRLPDLLAEIQKQHPDKKLRLFFQDESRFGQQGTLTNIWAKTGSRPEAVRQTAYQYVWVSAAVCPS
jgi:transposase